MFKKIVICGIGLIGGSCAAALKAAGAVQHVVGMGRRPEVTQQALALGLIDEIATDWASALDGAELVMLGMPVGQIPAVLRDLLPHLPAHVIVTDASSTKADVVAAAHAILGERVGQFIPGHPIAGAEKSGPAAAAADLYQGKRVILSPLPENKAEDLARVQRLWELCGAKVASLAPDVHDRVFASISHLPHLLSYALVHDVADRENAEQLFSFAAAGFRDFTRLASSHEEMWRDICLANKKALLSELDTYMTELLQVRLLLAGSDAVGLETYFHQSRTARDTWLQGMLPLNEA